MLVAVSGGVDSVVLLDMLMHRSRLAARTGIAGQALHTIAVAHVDHGIRGKDSAADARFVEGLARHYGVPYVSTRLELGPDTSEDMARQARYAFLLGEARQRGAVLATAHHLDDMVGSVAINLRRGTGWRGLAVLNREGIVRPLLGLTKAQIYAYAHERRLEWVEDMTNQSPRYLRNRLRARLAVLPAATKQAIAGLRASQQLLARDIDMAARRIVVRHGGSRYFYTTIDTKAAIELLRYEIQQASGQRPTVPQAERALLAIKAGRAGKRFPVDKNVAIQLTSTAFYCRLPPQMIE